VVSQVAGRHDREDRRGEERGKERRGGERYAARYIYMQADPSRPIRETNPQILL
jgi:hypothetical protein